MRLIDADELIEIAHRIRLDSREQIERMIETAPTVDPVKHGHWIMPNKEKTDRPLAECSHCGWYVTKGGVLDFTYCPNCGAKMDEVEKDE